jgi:hypothetical protein
MSRMIEVVEKTPVVSRIASLQLKESGIGTEDEFIFWRAKQNGLLKQNGYISIDDAERLGYWLFGVVNDYRARQGPFPHPNLGTAAVRQSIPKHKDGSICDCSSDWNLSG